MMRTPALGSALAVLCVACASAASTVQVSTSEELSDALRRAKGGETIALTPGAYRLKIKDIHAEVTVTSADPANRAVMEQLDLNDSSGLTFADLELVAPLSYPSKGWPSGFFFGHVSHVRLDHLEVHSAPGGTLITENSGIIIMNSDHVEVLDSDFHDLHHGLNQFTNEYLTVRGNHFHHLRDDGIRGGGSSNVLIEGNFCEGNHPDHDDLDHPDCIQFWTTGTTAPAHDITIKDNVFVRADGTPVQGIFMGDEIGHYPYENVTISGNRMYGALWRGISTTVQHAIIENNIVCGYPDQKSWLVVFSSTDVSVNHNRADDFKYWKNSDFKSKGNQDGGPCKPKDAPVWRASSLGTTAPAAP